MNAEVQKMHFEVKRFKIQLEQTRQWLQNTVESMVKLKNLVESQATEIRLLKGLPTEEPKPPEGVPDIKKLLPGTAAPEAPATPAQPAEPHSKK